MKAEKTGVQMHRIVDVKIKECLPGGLRVQVSDTGEEGFVPQREISWNRSLRVSVKIPQPDEKRKALVLDSKRRSLRLSLRQVTDPWLEVIKLQKYKHGEIVIGEVVNVRNEAAYIQLEPGIDAIIYPKETSFTQKNIEDVLWLGDKIRVKIISSQPRHHRLEVSLVQALQNNVFESLLEKFDLSNLAEDEDNDDYTPFLEKQTKHLIYSSVDKKKLERVLIVDNDKAWLEFLAKQVETSYGSLVDVVNNSDDGWDKIEKGTLYNVLIIDIQLENENGKEFAEEIKKEYPELPILLISESPQDVKSLRERYPAVSFSTKTDDLGEIFSAIDQIRMGRTSLTGTLALDKISMRNLDSVASMTAASRKEIERILIWNHDSILPTYSFLVALDAMKQEIRVVQSVSILSEDEEKKAQDGLFYSPARQIIEEERIIIENDVDCREDRRYRNFFPTLLFRSFLGMPVQIPGEKTRYALILLDEEPGAFSSDDVVHQCAVAGQYLSIILERLNMLDTMERYQYTHAMGMLLGDFVHELNHRLQILNDGQKKLDNLISRPPKRQNEVEQTRWLAELEKSVKSVRVANESVNTLTRSYTQQIDLKKENIDVHALLDETVQKLAGVPTKTKIIIRKKYASELPYAQSIRENLKQIFTNILLNAVQLINYQQSLWEKERKQTIRPVPYKSGYIIVQTLYNEGRRFPIEIRIFDNGPGIHWRDQQHIFDPHFSKRGGAGLGLYITRNIIHRVGGNVALADSVLFEGSVFRIELPVAEEE